MEDKDKPAAERLPYLELEEELPEAYIVPKKERGDAPEKLRHSERDVQGPVHSGFPQQTEREPSLLSQLRSTSPLTLMGLFLSILVILLLLPQAFLILRGLLMEVVLLMRVLLIPLLAMVGTIYLLRWYYYRNR